MAARIRARPAARAAPVRAVGPGHGGPGRVFLLLLAYRIGFWAWKGTTIGGIIRHLRVVRADGVPLRFGDALARGLSSVFSFAVLGLGCLFIL